MPPFAVRLRAFAILVLALPCGRVAAQAVDTVDLPEARARAAAAPPGQEVRRIEGEALRRFATLEDALASLPGFRVRRAGGLGGYSELSFRGAAASAVAVYVDGIHLNQDGEGAPDLSKWPSLWFSSLTARTGFEAGAGAGTLARIDLSTHSRHRAEAHARLGSFGTGEVAAQASGRLPFAPGWTLTAGAQAQAARNDYPVESDNGTLYNTADDRAWRIDNNAYASRGARATARRARAEGSQEFSLLWLDSRKEYPGLFPRSARAHTLRTDWLAAWRMARPAWEAGAQARRLEESYRDPNQSLGPFSFEQARVSRAAELDAAALFPVASDGEGGHRFDARLDARLRAEDVTPTKKPFTQQLESPAAERYEGEAGARLFVRGLPSLPEVVALTFEARPAWIRFRADGVRTFPSGPLGDPVAKTYAPLALRAAAEWPTRAGAFGVVARREPRPPSSGEFLGDNNGIQHNPDLRPEEARALSLLHELSFEGRDGTSAGLRTTLYANRYENPIRLGQRGTSPFLRYENGASYRALGAEWTASASSRLLEASLSVSAQDAAILEGYYEGNRPAWLSEAEAHAEAHLKPAAGFRLGALLDLRGPYYPGDANVPVTRRDAEWELGAHAAYARGPARLAFDARNLFDRRYRDFARSPRSGRAFSLTLSLVL